MEIAILKREDGRLIEGEYIAHVQAEVWEQIKERVAEIRTVASALLSGAPPTDEDVKGLLGLPDLLL